MNVAVSVGFSLAAIMGACLFVLVYGNESHTCELDERQTEHAEQLATLAGRLQSLADFLGVDVHDAVDDSPAALADVDTEEFPVAPPTVPDGMPLAVQSALLGKSAEWVEEAIKGFRFSEGGRR